MAGLSSVAQGLTVPHFETLAVFHPGFALAIVEGVPCRPQIRALSVEFDASAQVGAVQPASFSQVIGAYSVFSGVDITIDPTNAFPGNPVKYVNDAGMALVSGITVEFTVRGADDYTPIADPTPLQSVPRLLAAAAGVWSMDNPDNVKARFTLQAIPNSSPDTAFPITVWMNLSFLVLAPEGCKYVCLDIHEARQKLAKHLEWLPKR
jgi:hypothetical protein